MLPYLLSALVFIPLAGSVISALIPTHFGKGFSYLAIAVTSLLLAVSLAVYVMSTVGAGYQFEERAEWISLDLGDMGRLAIDYHLGVDGLSIPMVLLSGIVLFVGAIASLEIKKHHKGYTSLYLLLSATVMGCFVALDFFLFFLFFEFMLLPMYFLIGIWGSVRREYAALKFLIYTLAGSVMVLLVMIALYSSTASPSASGMDHAAFHTALRDGTLAPDGMVYSFDIPDMVDPANVVPGSWLDPENDGQIWGWSYRGFALLLLLIGFGIKLPVVPVHTWLPDAHVEAPTPISVVLAGVLLKVGGYGLFRIAAPIFPDELVLLAPWIGGFGTVSILYGAMIALGSSHLKKMIACSSISHMGFVMIGLASLSHEGWSGAVFQMFSHGIISAMLFILAGVFYSRSSSLEISKFKGISSLMPAYGTFVAIAFFAALGLPGFSGFFAELLVFLGGFSSSVLPVWIPLTALLGLILTAAYFLWTYQRMFLGSYSTSTDVSASLFSDLSAREWILLSPLALIALLFGIFPSMLLDLIAPFVDHFLSHP